MVYKVLIVSNNASLAQNFTEALAHATADCSYETSTVSFQNINSVVDFKPKLIIVDAEFINQSTGHISLYKSSLQVPVMLVADFNRPNLIQLAIDLGVAGIVSPTVSYSELVQRVRYAIERSESINLMKFSPDQLKVLVSAISGTGNSVIIIGRNGQISWVNDGFKRMYELSFDEVRQVFDAQNVFAQEPVDEFTAAVKTCYQTHQYATFEASRRLADGTNRYIQTTLTPIIDDGGKVAQIVAIGNDITDIKQAEDALEKKNRDLLLLTENLQDANTKLAEQRAEVEKQAQLIDEERGRSEALLQNILPWEVARALRKSGTYKPKKFKKVSVMFTDFIGFSSLSTMYDEIEEFLSVLDQFFEAFDDIVSHHFIEKIKTVGDSYMCVGGLPRANRSHEFDTVLAALEMQSAVKQFEKIARDGNKPVWRMRIGIHTGTVIAGVIGKKKFAYDIWGDTVNIASRMESEGEGGRVNISEITYNSIKDYFCCISRGKIPAKNIGEINMYFVERIKPEYSEDEDGLVPNATFRKILASF